MDVSLPIQSVIPSLDGPVLAALAGTTHPANLSTVHRLAGRGSLQGVRRVLHRLVRAGLVHEVPGGFILNRDHLAADAVLALSGLHGLLIKRLRDAVDAWPGQVALLGLYGSAARRDGDEQSDIDVLLLSDDSDAESFAAELAVQVEAWTGNRAQVVTRSAANVRRLRRAKEPIVTNWERELVVVVGDRSALRAS